MIGVRDVPSHLLGVLRASEEAVGRRLSEGLGAFDWPTMLRGDIGPYLPLWVAEPLVEQMRSPMTSPRPWSELCEAGLHGVAFLERPLVVEDMGGVVTGALTWHFFRDGEGPPEVMVGVYEPPGGTLGADDPGMAGWHIAGTVRFAIEQGAAGRASPVEVAVVGTLLRLLDLATSQRSCLGLAHHPRPVRRRCARASLPSDVVVVDVRRPKMAPAAVVDGVHVDWSHRWPVRGHWRDQWYASLGEHRRIWIEPYVKGPKEKPFVAKTKIGAVK